MPTATTTVTAEALSDDATSILSLKAAKPTVAESSTAATLRSLYPRAAKAFLQRDFALTHSLVTSAFALVGPPTATVEDELEVLRRKWDILRITLEITVYTSPPPSEDALPAQLRDNQTMSPSSLIQSLYTRSVQLFTPSAQAANPAYLPYQILYTLGSAGVKLGCGDMSRSFIEDWLARRVPDNNEQGRKGYAKVIELYCVHVLPRLEEWQYAEDFLQYEQELDSELRENLIAAVRESHLRTIETRSLVEATLQASKAAASSSSSANSSRAVSPAPSTSSESSTSTHTATPRTPHPEHKKGKGRAGNGTLNGLTHLTPSTPPSRSTDSNATARTVTPRAADKGRMNGARDSPRGRAGTPTPRSQPRSNVVSPTPQPSRSSTLTPPAVRPPTTLTILRTYLHNVLTNASKAKLAAFFLLFVVFPFLSFMLRMRRRRMIMGGTGTANQVRRRLRGVEGGAGVTTGLIANLWEEIVRAVGDTIRMGGGGLV